MIRILFILIPVAISSCAREPVRSHVPSGPPPIVRAHEEQAGAAEALASLEHDHLGWPEDREQFAEAAKTAWTFVSRQTQPTGLVEPLATYSFATIWDAGSMLAAVYSARGLGLIDRSEYDRRITRMLSALTRMRLSSAGVFGKSYETRTGALADGSGSSATDVGRLLIWLRIVGESPRHARDADAVVRRMDLAAMVDGGYLWGLDFDPEGKARRYREGAIGYEQYAAKGFALWGVRAEKALDLDANAIPVTVMDQPLVADVRRVDRLTNEPFLLIGLEIGWDARMARLTRRLLLAQQERYRKTGAITMVGEDAIDLPPHHFYYYSVYSNGKAFGVDVQDRRAVVDGPRWASAKAAFAFHALMPTAYTQLAVRSLDAARTPGGWASGVYESNGASTGPPNLNTAAVILEAALYQRQGLPLLEHASRGSEGGP